MYKSHEIPDRRRRLINNITLRLGAGCIVCGKVIERVNDMVIVERVNSHGRRIANLALRHSVCQRSKYRPVERDIVTLIETMIASEYKLCPLCKKSWVPCELEELVLVERSGVKDVVHLVCI